MKKIFLVLPILALVVGLGFFAIPKPKTASADCFLGFCGSSPDTGSAFTYQQEAAKTEVNQRVLDKNQPLPQITQSLERANLIERLKRFNEPSKISYIYLISFGKIMSFYTVKGKVSSVNSYLSASTQLVRGDGSPCNDAYTQDCYQVESPDMDGSYGTNGNAIFFFTTAGTYVEWNGEYMMADSPLQLATPPELTMSVK